MRTAEELRQCIADCETLIRGAESVQEARRWTRWRDLYCDQLEALTSDEARS